MEFFGIKPLERQVPLIEVETESGQLIDLHNDCFLVEVAVTAAGLAFRFKSQHEAAVEVCFDGVRNLIVEQVPDWVPEEAAQIDHFLLQKPGLHPEIYFKAGGMTYEFDASRIVLTPQSES